MKDKKNATFFYDVTSMFQADQQFRYAREPLLRRMPDGTLGAVIYTGGDMEPDPDNRNIAAFVYSEDDGMTWSKPHPIVSHPFRNCWGTELCTLGEVPFVLFQTFDARTYYDELRCFVMETDDCGRSWKRPRTLAGFPPNISARQIRKLSDGSWLCPCYWKEQNEFPGNPDEFNLDSFVAGAARSTDNGRTFSIHGYLHTKNCGLWEPDIIELENGHLLMLLRADGSGFLYRSESFDFGQSWTPVIPSDIPNPGAKFTMHKIANRIILITNTCPDGRFERSRLEIRGSDDGCKSWSFRKKIAELSEIEHNPDNGFWQVSYPHGFPDDIHKNLYLAIDCCYEFFLMKIPYDDLLQ